MTPVLSCMRRISGPGCPPVPKACSPVCAFGVPRVRAYETESPSALCVMAPAKRDEREVESFVLSVSSSVSS